MARNIGFYGTPPVLLASAYAVYRIWFAGSPTPPAAGPEDQPGSGPPVEQREAGTPRTSDPGMASRSASGMPSVQGLEPAPAAADDEDSARAQSIGTIEQAEARLPELAAEISPFAEVVRWARMPGILMRLVAAVDAVANGTSPRRHLTFLRVNGPFEAVRKGGSWVMSDASMARYDHIVRIAVSVDSARCAAVFQRLEPALDLGYRRLGYGEGRFRDALADAAAELLEMPVPAGEIELVRRGPVFDYADPRLAELSEARKHLLRAGPRNARQVQTKIRELAEALGLSLR